MSNLGEKRVQPEQVGEQGSAKKEVSSENPHLFKNAFEKMKEAPVVQQEQVVEESKPRKKHEVSF